MQKIYDVAVLGVGSMGSAACYYLAGKGAKVLGIEQFGIPHELGSHAGQSRIIRKAYFEHPDYVPLLERAYRNWQELESISGSQVYFPTGLLYGGRHDHPVISGTRQSAASYGIPLHQVSPKEAGPAYPAFRFPANYDVLFEPGAGFLTPERAILLYADESMKKGAEIHTREKTLHWERSGELIHIRTTLGEYRSKKLVITAGPWAGQMVQGSAGQAGGKGNAPGNGRTDNANEQTKNLSGKLRVTRQVIAWMNPADHEAYALGNFPCWMIAEEGREGVYYGFPVLPVGRFGGPIGLKLGYHHPGLPADPDAVDRDVRAAEEEDLVRVLKTYIPGAYASTHVMKVCLYTNTPDEHFVVDFLPGHDPDVVVATGFSGHGFKFASVIGEIMSDLALDGRTSLPIGFLHADRLNGH